MLCHYLVIPVFISIWWILAVWRIGHIIRTQINSINDGSSSLDSIIIYKLKCRSYFTVYNVYIIMHLPAVFVSSRTCYWCWFCGLLGLLLGGKTHRIHSYSVFLKECLCSLMIFRFGPSKPSVFVELSSKFTAGTSLFVLKSVSAL